MTWSQMNVFAAAARIARLSDFQMQLSIAHNPYRSDHARLPRTLRQAIGAIRTGRSPAQAAGVSVRQLEGLFGKAKRVQVSKEELLAKLQPRVKR